MADTPADPRSAPHPQPPKKDLLQERGGAIDPRGTPGVPIDDDDRIDQAIAESFPASDPPSWNSGID
jgi:hypothetical protein